MKVDHGWTCRTRRCKSGGASMVECALLIVLIGVVCVVAVTAAGEKSAETFCLTAGHLNGGTVSFDWHYDKQTKCCGYNRPGMGGGFTPLAC